MENSHFDCATDADNENDAYDEVKFNLTSTAHLQLDDFSDNTLKNLFSEENSIYGSETKDRDLTYNNIRTGSLMADNTSGMTLLSRSDFDGTFPNLTFKDNVLSNWAYWDNYRVTDNVEINSSNGLPTNKKTWDASYDMETDPWYKSADDIPTSWIFNSKLWESDENDLKYYKKVY